ncbi:MAG TPA: laminin B domain-containing protein, partial [Verrucomicrobiota bacterium]|nr:laminin B domain-containing protein [Verrucomicrobiota bacterium]HQL79033.1 laminin B domain-containing protein [Verrucomicrobiota bacterium]
MRTSTLLTVAALSTWTALAPAYGHLAGSTFDVDADGWTVVERANDSLTVINTRSPVYTNSGGNPTGYVYATDAAPDFPDFYFRAPAKFLGNQQAAYGYPLVFDLISDFVNTPTQLVYSVILTGAAYTNVITVPRMAASNTWTHFVVMLQAGAGWVDIATGLPSTSQALSNCLGTLQSLDIAGEFGTGPDTGGIDNVTLSGPDTTVVWDRKAHGQAYVVACLGSTPSTYHWPNNNNWSQYEHWALFCNPPNQQLRMTEPSNWSTTNYPNDPGLDVILGNNGGAPTRLDVPVRVHSVTVLPEGGLELHTYSTLTADWYDFQGDGAILGSFANLRTTEGGTLTKSRGSGTLTIGPGVNLAGSGVTFVVNSGELCLKPLGGNDECWTNYTYNVAPNATNTLDLGTGWMWWYGTHTGTGGGRFEFRSGEIGIVNGITTTLSFPGAMFQWTGGAFYGGAGSATVQNVGTINLAGSAQKMVHYVTLINSGTINFDGTGNWVVDTTPGVWTFWKARLGRKGLG